MSRCGSASFWQQRREIMQYSSCAWIKAKIQGVGFFFPLLCIFLYIIQLHRKKITRDELCLIVRENSR